MNKELRRRKELAEEEVISKIENSKYNKRYKNGLNRELSKYIRESRSAGEIKTEARVGYGNLQCKSVLENRGRENM